MSDFFRNIASNKRAEKRTPQMYLLVILID